MMERGKAYHIKYQFIRVQREGETREERVGVNQNCEEALCFLDLRERERERERREKRWAGIAWSEKSRMCGRSGGFMRKDNAEILYLGLPSHIKLFVSLRNLFKVKSIYRSSIFLPACPKYI
jgi:hypothetical protein